MLQTARLPKPGMMRTDIKIRKAVLGDTDEIVKTEEACFRDAWGAGSIRAELQKDFAELFVAEAGGGTAGCLLVYKIDGEAEIVRLAVRCEYRRQGIACALLKRAFEGFGGNIYLDVRKSNAAAAALYKKAGFEAYDLRPGYYRNPPEDAVLMRKLQKPHGSD